MIAAVGIALLSFTPPHFDFSSPGKVDSNGVYNFYLTPEKGGERKVVDVEKKFYVAFPFPYNGTDVDILYEGVQIKDVSFSSEDASSSNETLPPYTDPYTQTIFFRTGMMEPGNVSLSSREGKSGVRVAIVTEGEKVDASSLLSLPIYGMRTRGDMWRGMMYDWIFLIVSVVVCVIYIVAFRERIVEATFLLSSSFFLTSAGSKVYYSGLNYMLAPDTPSLVFSICISVLCVDVLACLFCFLASLRCRCRPYLFFTLSFLYGAALLFLGGGIYAGPSLLIIASFLLISSHL